MRDAVFMIADVINTFFYKERHIKSCVNLRSKNPAAGFYCNIKKKMYLIILSFDFKKILPKMMLLMGLLLLKLTIFW